jgi:hypothetical protein
MGCPLQVGALKWSHQVTGLWEVHRFFCLPGRLWLGPEVTHWLFIQGVHICCYYLQAAAKLAYSCNSGSSAHPQARWDCFICV